MVKMINAVSGNVFYVHESRVEEYTAAGHKLAADVVEKADKKPVKKASKK